MTEQKYITVDEIATALCMVLEDDEMPSDDAIELWSQKQRNEAFRWATIEIFKANDYEVEIPPKPDFI